MICIDLVNTQTHRQLLPAINMEYNTSQICSTILISHAVIKHCFWFY